MSALRLHGYVLRINLAALGLTLGVILLAILLVDVVEQMRTIGSRADIGFLTAIELSLLKTPRLIYETLPFAILIGAMLSYSGLSRKSELPAIRAAGVSAWRFLAPCMGLAFMTGVAMVSLLDPLATQMNRRFEERRDEILLARPAGDSAADGVWLSQGDLADGNAGAVSPEDGIYMTSAIITARRVVGRAQALEDVTFFFYRPVEGAPDEREFSHRIDAKRAVLVPGFWQLQGVIENRDSGEVNRVETLALPTSLAPDTLLSRFASSRTVPFWSLPRFISDARAAGLDTDSYVFKLHTLLSTPFLMTAMALTGALACLGLARSGGMTRLIGAGAFAGLGLFFVTRVAAGLSASGAAPPEAAAWAPSLAAFFTTLAFISFLEDG